MSITVPLSVRIAVPGRADRHITKELRSLRFREVAYGGYASITMQLDRPLSQEPDDVQQYARVYVYDRHDGEVVCEGRLEDPGRGAGADGEVWQLVAMGPAAHSKDRTESVVYVDKRVSPYIRVENVTPGGDFNTGTDPGQSASTTVVEQSLIFRFPDGLHLVTNSRVVARYDLLRVTGQKLARFDYSWDAGLTSPSISVEALARTDGGTSGAAARSDTFNLAGGGASPRLIVTHWASGRTTLDLRIIYTSTPGTITTDTNWAAISNVVVMATRYDQSGNELLTALDYTANTVTASQIIADLLGRWLNQYDGANATIATTSYPIEQLAYEQGVSPDQIIGDLLVFEPGYRWGAYESNSAGKHRFEFIAWPSAVRYEATIGDGIDSPGSAVGLYNRVTVRYVDRAGATRTVARTASVPVLTAAGLTRTGWLDLGDEVGNAAAAARAGDQWLLEHNTPPNQGRLVVSRDVLDLVEARMVAPYAIKAGELIRVRGIVPRVDALNASDRDGVSVFRIAAKDYDTATAAAVLELDSQPRTVAAALAAAVPQLGTRPPRRPK